MLDYSVVPRAKSTFQAEYLDGEAVLLDISTLRVVHLNSSAAVIWSLCDGRRRVEEIRSLLAAAYPEAASGLDDDLAETLASLVAAGALEIVGDDAAY